MDALTPSSIAITLSTSFSVKPPKAILRSGSSTLKIKNANNITHLNLPFSSYSTSCICLSTRPTSSATAAATFTSSSSSIALNTSHWMVLVDRPPLGLNSKPEIVDYYVQTLERVLGNEKDAQMCIYNVSCDGHFGFCCDVDEEASRELARLPGVLLVRQDLDYNSEEKDYSFSNVQLSNLSNSPVGDVPLFPFRNTKHWLVRIDKPGVGVVTKAQMVDYYTQILTKVLGNEKDAQMCLYHVSWQSHFGFCCEIDDECAKELAGVPGVLAVEPDNSFDSENKDYGGNNLRNLTILPDSAEATKATPIKAKKLFVTGLSFYTSEKTLRAAFEGFGELVEVKIIMDKISKRSKGYAFIEYTTEEAASAALEEMNGKIINGWMIVVDVAKPKAARSSQTQPMSEI